MARKSHIDIWVLKIDQDPFRSRPTNYSPAPMSETEQTACLISVIFILAPACLTRQSNIRAQNHPAAFETSWYSATRCATRPETSVNISLLLSEGV
jgi:hypothetical protein